MKIEATVCDVCMGTVSAQGGRKSEDIALFLPGAVVDCCSVACLKAYVAGIEVEVK